MSLAKKGKKRQKKGKKRQKKGKKKAKKAKKKKKKGFFFFFFFFFFFCAGRKSWVVGGPARRRPGVARTLIWYDSAFQPSCSGLLSHFNYHFAWLKILHLAYMYSPTSVIRPSVIRIYLLSGHQLSVYIYYPAISYPYISIVRPWYCSIYCLFSTTKVLLKTKTK